MKKYLLACLLIGGAAAISKADSTTSAQSSDEMPRISATWSEIESENPGLATFYRNRAQSVMTNTIPPSQQSGLECPVGTTKAELEQSARDADNAQSRSDTGGETYRSYN